jgi:uncharacterized membrane protein YeaQ/YmgE (transglycosylase-associated protein family)
MSVLAWIILGLIAGFIASNILNRAGQGLLLDILLGIVGAVVSRPSARRASPASISTVFSSLSLVRSPCFGSTTPSADVRPDRRSMSFGKA